MLLENMSNHGKPDHWQSLAFDLGAKVPAEPDPSDQTSSEDPSKTPSKTSRSESPPTAEPPRASRPPRAPRPQTNWTGLAESLGVPSESPQLAPPEVSATEAEPCVFSEALDWMEPQPLIEPLDEAALDTPPGRVAPEDGCEESTKERLSRKRRKRRRRPRESTSENETKTDGAEPDPLHKEPQDLVEEESVAHPTDEATGEVVVTPSKRRRRGRGRRKSASKRVADDTPEQDVEEASDEPLSDDEPTRERGRNKRTREEMIEPDDESDPNKPGPSHRGIPSWEEAVGVVVAANLEARSKKSPKEASSRTRGNRSRGGKAKTGSKRTKPN